MSTVMVATRALLTLMVSCMPLAACQAQLPPDKDHTKTVSITKEQREQMDVAFFNDFVVRDMPAEMWRSGANHPGSMPFPVEFDFNKGLGSVPIRAIVT